MGTEKIARRLTTCLKLITNLNNKLKKLDEI